MKKGFKIYFTIIASFVFIISVIRSIKMGITCDEAITYLLFVVRKWDFSSHLIANNHILNTILIMIINFISKSSFNHFVIRIPNLLFYIMYIVFTYKLSKLYKNKTAIATVLLLNYAVNEFASVARGYGIASALVLGGIYYYKKYLTNHKEKALKLSIVYLFISSLANTISLILVGLFIMDSVIRMIKLKKLKEFINNSKIFIICTAFVFLTLLSYHFYISFTDRFLSSCTKSIFSCMVYSPIHYYGADFISKGLLVIIIILFIGLFVYFNKKIQINFNSLFYMIIVIYVILLLCKIIFPFNLPTGRTLIPFFSIYIISIFDFIDLFTMIKYKKYIYLIIMVIAFLAFFSNLSVNYIREWKNDQYLKNLVEKRYKQNEIISLEEIPVNSYPTMQYYYQKYKILYSYPLITNNTYKKILK